MIAPDHIWINGRKVSYEALKCGEENPKTAFEKNTFEFIQKWLNGEDDFTIKTSGSTGTPKNISVTRQQMTASAHSTINALRLQPGGISLLCIDTRYIGGQMMIVRTLVNNMYLFAADPEANPLAKIPESQCVNFAAFVPYQVQQMLGSKRPHLLNNIDAALIGGAPLSSTVIDMLEKFRCRFYATYGMTETISHVALRPLNGQHATDFFESLPGVELAVDDRDCLIIKTPYLIEPVITNDRVELMNNRQFRWLGRWDNVINTGGIKVSPEKLESIISPIMLEAGLSNRFFIQGIDDERFGNKICMIVEAADLSIRDELVALFPKVSSVIEPYERPREVLIIPAFELTESGKVNRSLSLQKVTASFPLKK